MSSVENFTQSAKREQILCLWYFFCFYWQAVEDFHSQVSSVAGLVLEEFRLVTVWRVVEGEYLLMTGLFFFFLHKIICCGYSLEVPHWGDSNQYPHFVFMEN